MTVNLHSQREGGREGQQEDMGKTYRCICVQTGTPEGADAQLDGLAEPLYPQGCVLAPQQLLRRFVRQQAGSCHAYLCLVLHSAKSVD